jgi:transcriptional regulator with XRE-family HTH domain
MGLTALGKVVKTRRKDLKITQPQLADLAGISKNTLYKLSNPTIEVLMKIADVLGMEIRLEVKSKN